MLAMDAVEIITDEDDEVESSVNLYAALQQMSVQEKRGWLQDALSIDFGVVQALTPRVPSKTLHMKAWAAVPVG